MKKKKLSLNKLFQNNKFLIILALVISTITWVYMSMGTTNDTTVTISNIPIQIELPDQLDNNGLQVLPQDILALPHQQTFYHFSKSSD